MKANKIIIDSIYLNSEGGKEILSHLIEYLQKRNLLNNYYFLIDKRFNKNKLLDIIKYEYLNSTEIARRKFYLNTKISYKSVVCMSNIPPPLKLKQSVFIYFHNVLLLKPFKSNQGFNQKIFSFFKKIYIKFHVSKSYKWIVQTELIRHNLSKSFSISKKIIEVMPIFGGGSSTKKNRIKNSFLYVGSISRHKNHKRLFKAFIDASKKINNQIQLHLTIPENDFIKSIYNNLEFPKNLKIINHGILEKNKLNTLYSTVEFSIFPSLNESFGLPLLESINNGTRVVAADLDYVNEIIIPSLKFDPESITSISDSILLAIHESELKESKILVQNKIDTFVKYISMDV